VPLGYNCYRRPLNILQKGYSASILQTKYGLTTQFNVLLTSTNPSGGLTQILPIQYPLLLVIVRAFLLISILSVCVTVKNLQVVQHLYLPIHVIGQRGLLGWNAVTFVMRNEI